MLPNPKLQKAKNRSKSKKPSVALSPKTSSYKMALVALFVLITFILIGKTIELINTLKKPLNSAPAVQRAMWDKRFSFTAVLKFSEVSILHYEPSDEKLTLLQVPNDTYMQLPKGFGSWPVRSIYDLGQGENPPIGALLLKKSLSRLLGLPVDAYIVNKDPEDQANFSEKIASIRSNPISTYSFLKNIESDLTPLELLDLISLINNARSDKTVSLDIGHTSITESRLLPDSTRVLGVDSIQLDLFVRSKLADAKILDEGATVAVFNATTHPGLAQQVARVVTNLGGNVTFSTNTEQPSDKTLVISSEKNQTFERLAQFLAPHCLETDCKFPDHRISSSRSQINIVVGEDYYINEHKK